MKYMKKVVLACLVASIIYVIVAIIFQVVTGEELSPTLTDCFLRGVIVELSATALIKVGEGWIDSFRIKHMADYRKNNPFEDGFEFDDSQPDEDFQFDENAGE